MPRTLPKRAFIGFTTTTQHLTKYTYNPLLLRLPMSSNTFQELQDSIYRRAAEVRGYLANERPDLFGAKISNLMVSLKR